MKEASVRIEAGFVCSDRETPLYSFYSAQITECFASKALIDVQAGLHKNTMIFSTKTFGNGSPLPWIQSSSLDMNNATDVAGQLERRE